MYTQNVGTCAPVQRVYQHGRLTVGMWNKCIRNLYTHTHQMMYENQSTTHPQATHHKLHLWWCHYHISSHTQIIYCIISLISHRLCTSILCPYIFPLIALTKLNPLRYLSRTVSSWRVIGQIGLTTWQHCICRVLECDHGGINSLIMSWVCCLAAR